MDKNSKIYVVGHTGLVGSAIKRKLEQEGYKNIIFKNSSDLDLKDQSATKEFFIENKPEYVFAAAAKVGGIHANDTYRADFIYENLQIQNNLIHYSWKTKVNKLLFFASNCIYPKNCPQPIKEEYLLSNYLEPTNEPYAIAKISGIKMCEAYNKQYGTNFIAAVPANLFGPNDNYDTMDSHFVAGFIRKFHDAKMNNEDNVVLWGTGNPKREVMFVNDLAEASLFLMQKYDSSEIINIGTSKDKTIREYAELIKEIVGFSGNILFDKSKPDGISRKLLDSKRINDLGWKSKTDLKDTLKLTYKWFLENLYKEKN